MTEESIFAEALEKALEERSAFLVQACGGDTELRERIQQLLDSHEEADDSFLAKPAEELGRTIQMSAEERESAMSRSSSIIEHEPPSVIVEKERSKLPYFREYVLMGEIARGAMGVVYRAEQSTLKRSVAIKMIRSTLLANESDVERFKLEAEAAASLDHPNIVPIYEVGEFEGQHYFTMKLVEGGTLRDRMPQFQRDTRLAAEFMRKVASAVHAAHQRGILHRDIKPGNILVDHENEPHVTDFGLAKQMDSASGLTLSGQILGTPNYMAPEQAEASANLTTAADIYGLGAVFYEMLTGEPPFKGETTLETLRLLTEAEAPHPSLINERVNGDLATIALKCLSKEPKERYASAQGLVNDLECWLNGEPIKARPVSTGERITKWIKRKPMRAATAGLAVLFLLTLGIGGPIIAFHQTKLREDAETARNAESDARALAQNARLHAEDATRAAEQLAESNRRSLYAAEMLLAGRAIQGQGGSGLGTAREMIEHWIPAEGEVDYRGWEWYFLASQAKERAARILRHANTVRATDWTPDGSAIVSVSNDARMILWDAATGEQIHRFDETGGVLDSVAVSPDGLHIAAGFSRKGKIRIWEISGGSPVVVLSNDSTGVSSLAWSPDGVSLAVACDRGGTRIWNWRARTSEAVDSRRARKVVWDPSGKRLAIAIWDQDPIVMNLEEGSSVELNRVRGTRNCSVVDWSPDGRWLAGGDDSGMIEIWDPDTGELIDTYLQIENSVSTLRWSPDSQFLGVGDPSGRIQIWEPGTDTDPVTISGHTGGIEHISWSPDGNQFASSSNDNTARIWNWNPVRYRQTMESHFYCRPRWSPDGTKLAYINHTPRRVDVLDTEGQLQSFKFDHGALKNLTWSPNGAAWAVESWNRNLVVADAETGHVRFEVDGGVVRRAEWSPDGRWIAVFRDGEGFFIYRSDDGSEVSFLKVEDEDISSMQWRPDGSAIAFARSSKQIAILPIAQDGTIPQEVEFTSVDSTIRALSWSPDGKQLALGAENSSLEIWNPDTMEPERIFSGHNGAVRDICWHSDGSRIATASEDGRIRIWDTLTGLMVLSLKTDGPVLSVDWSSDGSRIVASRFQSGKLTAAVEIFDSIEGMADYPREENLAPLLNRDIEINLNQWVDQLETPDAVWRLIQHLEAENDPENHRSRISNFLLQLIRARPVLFEKISEMQPESKFLAIARARDHAWHRRWALAAESFSVGTRGGVSDPEVLMEAAAAAFLAKDSKRARRFLDQLIEKREADGKSEMLDYVLARTVALIVRDRQEAEIWAERLEPTLSTATIDWMQHAWGLLLMRAGETEEAMSAIQNSKRSNWMENFSYLSLAILAHSNGDSEQARALLNRADQWSQAIPVGSNRGAITDWLEFHVLRREAARLIEGRDDSQIDLFPHWALAPFFEFLKPDDDLEAAVWLRTALHAGFSLDQAAPELAKVLTRAEVVSLLENWIGEETEEPVDPQSSIDQLFLLRGIRYRDLGQIERSGAAYHHVKSASSNARDTFIRLRDWPAAAAQAERLANANPKDGRLRIEAATLHAFSGDSRRYKQLVDDPNFVQEDPGGASEFNSLVFVSLLGEKAEEQIRPGWTQELERRIELNAKNASPWIRPLDQISLALIRLRTGDPESAIRLALEGTQSLQSWPHTEAKGLAVTARIQAELGQVDAARQTLASLGQSLDPKLRMLERKELPEYWDRWLQAKILRRETEQLLSEMEKH